MTTPQTKDTSLAHCSPKQFLERCTRLAHIRGKHWQKAMGRHSISGSLYEDAALRVDIGWLTVHVTVKAVRRGKKEEFLIAIGSDRDVRFASGDLYKRWLPHLESAMGGRVASEPVDLGQMGFIVQDLRILQ